jgi:glycosyltransferase involved in cell wall biosynthesis
LYPHTIGGAERWYRNLGERLAQEGHEVTYLTLRQWERGVDPGVPGVRVVEVGPRLALYTATGRRRILPPLIFGFGVLRHLLRYGRRYETVHTASFPYFSLLAVALLEKPQGYRLFVDWHEAWTLSYWQEYLGGLGGWIGWIVQRLCLKVPHRAFCFSRLVGRRLRQEGYRGEPTVLEGEYTGPLERGSQAPLETVVMFAGRFIPEKRTETLIPAIARARDLLPDLRGVLYGDGPERERVQALVAAHGMADAIRVPGFVPGDEIDRALSSAMCMALPSRREGYGMIVVEAASHGTPSVVVAAPDNAAVELIEEGVNGVIAATAEPEELAAAIVRVHEAGDALRRSTADWFAANVRRLSIGHSLDVVARAYDGRQ